MTRQILLSNEDIGWNEFANRLIDFQRGIQTEPGFAYVETALELRHETEKLCHYLHLEDYTSILEPGEKPPYGLTA